MEQGIAGMVATTGQTTNIPDAYENEKFNQAIDKKTGYRTRAILCMPIKSEDQVIGVLQLINKTTGSGVFTSDDEDVMQIFLAIAGPILAESNLYEQIQGKSKGRGVEGTAGEGRPSGATSSKGTGQTKGMAGLTEGEEEEEQEEDAGAEGELQQG
jgi:signal transduction protein with GAF and PtsI domain